MSNENIKKIMDKYTLYKKLKVLRQPENIDPLDYLAMPGCSTDSVHTGEKNCKCRWCKIPKVYKKQRVQFDSVRDELSYYMCAFEEFMDLGDEFTLTPEVIQEFFPVTNYTPPILLLRDTMIRYRMDRERLRRVFIRQQRQIRLRPISPENDRQLHNQGRYRCL